MIGKTEIEKARALQAKGVMPLIGPLLDAWDGVPNDTKGCEELSGLQECLAKIEEAMCVDLADAVSPPEPTGDEVVIDAEKLKEWTQQARRDDWHMTFVGSDIRQMLAEIERLRAILIEANNFWRHDFSADVEAAADRLFKKLSANNTDPFGDRNAERQRRASLPSQNQTGAK